MTDRRPWIRPLMINGYEVVVEFDPVAVIQADLYATSEAQVLVEGPRSLAI